MTEIWIDAQLSPALAAWINRAYEEITVKSVRAVGLRDAEDEDVFRADAEDAATKRWHGAGLALIGSSLLGSGVQWLARWMG
ncbi:MAG: hypothetical protein GVY35_02505 [Bacteroidetes bacterium]|jgi:hypothetical protein|nr:hypothetical protein [Bacteroidota bacterium]